MNREKDAGGVKHFGHAPEIKGAGAADYTAGE